MAKLRHEFRDGYNTDPGAPKWQRALGGIAFVMCEISDRDSQTYPVVDSPEMPWNVYSKQELAAKLEELTADDTRPSN